MEAFCLKCPINAIFKVTDLEITRLRFNARLLQCLYYISKEAGWAGNYRQSHCQRVTGLIPLIAGVPVSSPPPSQTLLLPPLLKQLHEPESESVKIHNPTAESRELLFTRITMQGAPWSRRIVAAHKPTYFAAVTILIHSTQSNMQLFSFFFFFYSLKIKSTIPCQVVISSPDSAGSKQDWRCLQ